jgi:GT2 family glycosyltransferase
MKQLKTITSHLGSRRGLLLVGSSVCGLLAIVLDGGWKIALGSIALVGFAALFLILSIRISQAMSGVGQVGRGGSRRSVAAPESSVPAAEDDDRSAHRMATAIEILNSANSRLGGASEFEQTDWFAREGSAGAPLVTVVIPCFNEERFVADALRSIREQTFADWECLVVDDASTDRSLHEIWQSAKADARFRVLRHRSNSGLSASRNTGLRAARGKFITFLDADDLLMKDSLIDRFIAVSNHASDPHVLGSYCGVRISPEEVTLDDLPRRVKFESTQIIDLVSADSECPFNAHAPLLVTERLRALGGFNEKMRVGAEDWDLWYRAMRNGYIFVPARYTTAVYRQKRRSMVRTMPDGHVSEADRLIEAAHHPAEASTLTAPTPTPLTRPIGHYQALLHRADRALRFAAMALVAGDEQAATRALKVLEEVPVTLVERHLDRSNLSDRGLMRALAVSPRELNSVQTLSKPITEHLERLIRSASTRYQAEAVTPALPPAIGALLVPQHAGQLRQMLEVAKGNGFGQEDIGVLDIEREGGRQGVAGEIPDGTPRWSLNEWSLLGGVCDVVLVGTVRIGVVDQIARAVSDAGGRVIEVAQADAQLMRLPEARRQELVGSGSRPIVIGTHFFGLGANPVDNEPTSSWQSEENPETVFDSPQLASFKDRHRGERVVIIGNGPSLNDLDLTRLKTEHTIAVNGIFYAAEQMGFDPTYYLVEDTAVMRDNLDEIIAYEAGHKFFPSIYRRMVGERQNVSYFMMNRGFYEATSPDFCVPRFSVDPGHHLFSGQSVTMINLQLAYHLGFEEVILIGMDFSYTVPDDAEVEGDVITSTSEDPNHFHPEYFGPGKVWKDPKLDRVLANYALAKQIYEADGRRIVNATAGGNLELFERADYTDLIG